MLTTTQAIHVRMKTVRFNSTIYFFEKFPDNTIVFFTLNIGLITKNDRIEALDIAPTNDLATKASDVEHNDIRYEKIPMRTIESTV